MLEELSAVANLHGATEEQEKAGALLVRLDAEFLGDTVDL